jgi:hypothetical protein
VSFRSSASVLTLLVCVSTAMSGRDKRKPLELEAKQSVDVANQSPALMVGSFGCDSDSNVFFMTPTGRGLPNRVIRVSADGRKTTVFSLGSAPGLDKSAVLAYSVGVDDRVYVLTATEKDWFVVSFEKDGQFSSAIKLAVAKGTGLTRIAVGPGETYFVGGAQQEGDKLIRKEMNAIFDSRGQMMASVGLRQADAKASDLKITDLKGSKLKVSDLKVSDLPNLTPDENLRAQKLLDLVDLSIVRSGEDGNFYFSRFDPNGPVFVISPTGHLIKEIRLSPPKEPGVELLDIKISKGRLAVAYQGVHPEGGIAPVTIDTYDSQTGKLLFQYHHQDWRIGLALACYSPDSFTFISDDENGNMRLVTAAAN